ncbi:MAG: ATP-binding protein [Phycisphaerae bacterium]
MTTMTAPRVAPPQRQVAQQTVPRPPGRTVAFGKIDAPGGHRVAIFGCGGSGKTSLACLAPPPVAFFDLERSLPILRAQLPTDVDIRPVGGICAWQDIRDALHSGGWDGVGTICIDSATVAEDLAIEHVIARVPSEKGQKVVKIGDYPYGAGYRYVYDEFVNLLSDLDAHARAGRHVVLIAHESTEKHPNPQGEDWLRAEPRLQHSPKSSIRERVRDWADHVLYLAYDVVAEDGKGRGSGTRTVYPAELPHCMAKSRTLGEPVPMVKNDRSVWDRLLGGAAKAG